MVKSGLIVFILKFSEPLQRYLQFCFSGQICLHWAAATMKGLAEFQNKNSRPLFTIFFKSKLSISRLESLAHLQNEFQQVCSGRTCKSNNSFDLDEKVRVKIKEFMKLKETIFLQFLKVTKYFLKVSRCIWFFSPFLSRFVFTTFLMKFQNWLQNKRCKDKKVQNRLMEKQIQLETVRKYFINFLLPVNVPC